MSRIQQVLDHVHQNLDKPLAVPELAERCGLSRWQFNRIFSRQTGLSLGRYVRELRLSRAAEMLLFTNRRMIDIALACGFNSDISFSRSFKQHFGCAPVKYRQRGLPCLLKTPMSCHPDLLPPESLRSRVPGIRLDSRPTFTVAGVTDQVNGLFSENPDFYEKLPRLWQEFTGMTSADTDCTRVGVLDVTRGSEEPITYLAGAEAQEVPDAHTLSCITVPERNYVVIAFHGPLASLADVLKWFFRAWLPNSGCEALNAQDLEIYPPGLNPSASEVSMEYWIPVKLCQPIISWNAPNC
ncbi:helix-turn-helix domain-containing protein [Marinobacter sp. 1_MG-2023]|uniref:helix-turn-helix domain-containing protein n=1 Tax=Marinobacter sp. 1_MG-2023 TaxID=3062627 RepID=UPI0026E1550E|nr:helix-turn-helix domain-containing protein [Marinobacter sp. 1_MG-2023]MDO6822626.1 helix-turn-helix domain-containing protein [Marinobacter sp. 1_MG-2023]